MSRIRRLPLLGGKDLPWYLSFPGAGTSGITCAAHASLNNLHDGALTVEGWFKPAAVQPDTNGTLFDKGVFAGVGYLAYLSSAGRINTVVDCATTDAGSNMAAGDLRTATWYHVAFIFDDAGDRKIYIAVNGAWQNTGTPTAGVGAVSDDTAQALKFGTRTNSADWKYSGGIGWLHVSNVLRYTAGSAFTPPVRAVLPTADANTVRLLKVNEGTGTALVDYSANAQNASVSGGTWIRG